MMKFFLYLAFLGIALAAKGTTKDEQYKEPLARVRRGLINVQKHTTESLRRLSNEFGEGTADRVLQAEVDALMDMSMSMSMMMGEDEYDALMEDMSMSMSMSMDEGKGKKAKKSKRRN